MSYLGNINGPKESEIVEKLGANYFGITWDQLEIDVSHHNHAEMKGEVVPLRLDENGEPYMLFSSPDKRNQRFYLLKEGYKLSGKILCLNDLGQEIYKEFE